MLVANRTATELPLLQAVRRRAQRGPVSFHLVVPATPQGLHRVVDPEDAGREAAAERLARALPRLSKAAGMSVLGHAGDANPLAAVSDALHLRRFDEVILSTLPWRVSAWLHLDLSRKIHASECPSSTSQAGTRTPPPWAARVPLRCRRYPERSLDDRQRHGAE